MRTKNSLIIYVIAALIIGTFMFPGCKKSSEADTFTLTVTVGGGVTGTPEAGTYTYNKDDKVTYSYALKDAYEDLKVSLDGQSQAVSGTITITKDCTLYAQSDPKDEAFSLTVTVEDGVTGTPKSGTTYYLPNTQIDYSYSLLEDYIDLKVRFMGTEIANSGSVTITSDSVLTVSATLHYDIRDSWALTEKYSDGSEFSGVVTFAGTNTDEGTVVDSDGGAGIFTVEGTYITFNLEFPNVTYQYTGLFASKNLISGTGKRIIPATGKVSGGTWTAKRNTSTTSVHSLFSFHSSNHKGEIVSQ
ncbi:MAG: hypothetical protein QG657_622 [Acidobacteriota bacterium]|nr:hypothetical protein [Acidobacteriota bacterium]